MELWDAKTFASVRTFTGHTKGVYAAISGNGRAVVSAGKDGTLKAWEIDWIYEFPGWMDWDERAAPYIQQFLRLYDDEAGEKIDRLENILRNNALGYLRAGSLRSRLKKTRG